MANKYDSQVGYVQDAPDPSSPKNQPGVAQAAVDGQTSASKNVVTMPTGILGDATVPALTKDKFPQFDLAGKDFTPYIPGPSERVGNTRYHADNYSPHDDDREVEINDGNTHITVDGGHVHVEQDGDHTTINIDGGHTTIDIDNDQPHSGHTTINIDSDDDHVYHGHDGEHHYGGHDDDDDHGDHDHDYHGDDGDDHGQPPGEQPKAQLNQDQQAVLEDIRRAAGNPADAQYYLHDAAHRLKSMGFDLGNPLANTGNLTAAQTDRLISQLGLDEKDYGGPTGPVDFLSWYGRLLSHDEQINGAAGDAGNGNIFEQIAADGFSTTNGQAATFAPDTKQANWLMAAIAWSLDKNDNGEFQIDGRAERDIGLGLTFAKAAGGSGILNELNDMPDHAANLDLSVANRFAPDPMKPGGMQQLGWTSGWSQTQIGIDAIVGHAMINGGRLTDDEMSDFFAHAGDMNVDPIDAGLLMASAYPVHRRADWRRSPICLVPTGQCLRCPHSR